MKRLLIMLGLLIYGSMAHAPQYKAIKVIHHVRILAGSAKQPHEPSKNAWGQSIKNEDYIATLKGWLPRGTIVRLPNGEVRVMNDHVNRKAEKRIGTRRIVEVYYYESVKSRPKTRAVNRELRRDYDQGWDDIEILWRP